MKRTVLILVIVTLLSLSAWACGGSSDEGAPEATAAEEQASPGPTGGEGLGETVTQGGYSLTVVAIEDPATPGARHNPAPGTRLMTVEIILRNEEGARPMKVDPLNASLYDTDGVKYFADKSALDDPIERKDLEIGDEVRGRVAFNVNEDATPARFVFEFVYGNRVEIDLE